MRAMAQQVHRRPRLHRAVHGLSQYLRDARIAMIYEGTNGVQALDLVGRKLGANGGRAVMALFAEIGDFCEDSARRREPVASSPSALKQG